MLRFVALAAVLALSFPAAAQQFRTTPSSAIAVTLDAGVYTATVMPDACDPTPYPEMTESDCQGGNRRSQMIAGAPARQGESWEYGFSFRVPEDFNYVPTELVWEIAQRIPDQHFWLFSRINMVEWKKDRPKNHIYHLKLDSVLGATFLDRVCAAPETFGDWVDFRMRVKWGARGFVQVSCDDAVIYEALTDTSQSPYCVPPLHCIPGQQADPGHVNQPLEMFVGLTAEVNASGLPPIVPPDGWSLHYRDLYQRRIDDPAPPFVRDAQQALEDAGFDPNGVDGQAGPGTRAALSDFQGAHGLEPTGEFDVATYAALGIGAALPLPGDAGIATPDDLPAVREAQAGLAAVDPAALLAEHPVTVTLIAEDIFQGGSQVVALFHLKIEDVPEWRANARFDVLARFTGGAPSDVQLRVRRPLGTNMPDAARTCQNRPRFSEFHNQHFAVYDLRREGTEWLLRDDPCLAEAMPPVVDYQKRMLATSMRPIAQAFVETEQYARLQSAPLAAWFAALAAGEITVSLP